MPKTAKTPIKVKCNGQMDGQRDRRTDGPTKRGVESRSTLLKRGKNLLTMNNDPESSEANFTIPIDSQKYIT